MTPLPFDMPEHWTDEEALIVFEFIDGIREQVWEHYCLQIQSAASLTRQVNMSREDPEQCNGQTGFTDDDIPF